MHYMIVVPDLSDSELNWAARPQHNRGGGIV
jgi:hypothetical protein